MPSTKILRVELRARDLTARKQANSLKNILRRLEPGLLPLSHAG